MTLKFFARLLHSNDTTLDCLIVCGYSLFRSMVLLVRGFVPSGKKSKAVENNKEEHGTDILTTGKLLKVDSE